MMNRVLSSTQSAREAYWRREIASCESSGQSIAQYCRDHGLSADQYRWWKSELKRRDMVQSATPRFAEVRFVSESASPRALLEVTVSGGACIRVWPGFDEATLTAVVGVLKRVSC
jgi:hypothetical protein